MMANTKKSVRGHPPIRIVYGARFYNNHTYGAMVAVREAVAAALPSLHAWTATGQSKNPVIDGTDRRRWALDYGTAFRYGNLLPHSAQLRSGPLL